MPLSNADSIVTLFTCLKTCPDVVSVVVNAAQNHRAVSKRALNSVCWPLCHSPVLGLVRNTWHSVPESFMFLPEKKLFGRLRPKPTMGAETFPGEVLKELESLSVPKHDRHDSMRKHGPKKWADSRQAPWACANPSCSLQWSFTKSSI